jgi:hypothetical protein
MLRVTSVQPHPSDAMQTANHSVAKECYYSMWYLNSITNYPWTVDAFPDFVACLIILCLHFPSSFRFSPFALALPFALFFPFSLSVSLSSYPGSDARLLFLLLSPRMSLSSHLVCSAWLFHRTPDHDAGLPEESSLITNVATSGRTLSLVTPTVRPGQGCALVAAGHAWYIMSFYFPPAEPTSWPMHDGAVKKPKNIPRPPCMCDKPSQYDIKEIIN